MSPTARVRWIAAALFVLAAALYIRTVGFPFILYDDDLYVYNNPRIVEGLSPGGIAWAFSGFHAHNWHPLTTLSHMLDVDLFGVVPWGPHGVNVLLHALATAVLFLALNGMTKSPIRSAFVAALFAVHPLHVESVAWISERKDVLSGLFFVAAIAAYGHYAEAPSGRRLLSVVILSALCMLSKPVAVTLPFVFLLLDFWPLGRLRFPGADPGAIPPVPARSLTRLLAEKLPVFAMSAILVVMTLLAQRVDAGIAGTDILPLAARISNACFAYVRYLRMTAWPAALSVIYPHPASVHQAIPTLAVMLSAALLAGVTIASFLQLKRRPWLLVGWLWFLGTLVPMIGLVQVGAQSVADRYMYLPSIGLFLAATWEISERASSWKPARRLVAPAACLVLALLAGLAWRQAGYWKNSETLFLQAAESSGGGENWYAEYLLGVLYQQEGRLADARSRFDKSLSIKPDHPPTRVNLGLVLARTGNSADGIAHLQEAARQAPDYYEAQVNLGLLQMGVGKKAEAVEAFRAALRIRPGDPTAASMLSFASR